MKTLKIICGLLILSGLTLINVQAQPERLNEAWEGYYLNTSECFGEDLIGTLNAEIQLIPNHVMVKASGTLYGTVTNEPYQVTTVQPGFYKLDEVQGELDATYTYIFHVYKDGEFVCVIHWIWKLRFHNGWVFQFYTERYDVQCK